MRSQQRLTDKYLNQMPSGQLHWIGLRPARREPMFATDRCQALAGRGLEGDRRMAGSSGSARQVTLISQEFIACIARHLGRESVDPAVLRRNLVVSGVNINALRYRRFRIGGALFEASAHCHPCSRMEQALGAGGFAAMMGLGGLCAKIIEGGEIAVGDSLTPLAPDSPQLALEM